MNSKSLSNLGIGLLLIILSMAGLSTYSYITSKEINERTAKAISHQEASYRLHSKMYSLVVERSKFLFQMAFETHAEDISQLKTQATKKKQELIELQEKSHDFHSPNSHKLFMQIENKIAKYHELEGTFLSLVEKNQNEAHLLFDTKVINENLIKCFNKRIFDLSLAFVHVFNT